MRDMTPQDKMLSVMGGRKPLALPEGTKKTDTAQPEGLFVDYYPERRAADVVNSQDFQPATIEADLIRKNILLYTVERHQARRR